MRRSRPVIAAALAALLALGVAAGSASAHGPCDPDLDGTATAREYAQLHISSHTPHGVGLGAHNPGTHKGYSLCLGVH